MGKTEKKLISGISKLKKRFGDSTQIAQFEEVSEEFEQLVKRGVAKKRGNNLLSPGDIPVTRHFSNTTQSDLTSKYSSFFDADSSNYSINR